MVDNGASDVWERAQRALSDSPIHAMRELRIEREAGVLILAGRVDTFYHKQLAQEIVRSVARDEQFINSICVEYVPG